MPASCQQEVGIDLRQVEASLQAAYREASVQYRRDDELEVATKHHQRLALILAQISSSFGRPISVLDLGCGTGRYFHCLSDVTKLVGVDLSPEMLQAAQTPVRQEEVSIENIELIQGNIHVVSFPDQSFDFIFSIGMFGYGCPLTVPLCDKFHRWLRVGGTLFFNALDVATLAPMGRVRNQARQWLYPLLPRAWRNRLEERPGRVPFFGLTKRSLRAILSASQFREFSISQSGCRSPLWKGIHLECEAWKPNSAEGLRQSPNGSSASAG